MRLALVRFCRVKNEAHKIRDDITHYEDELVICEQPTVRNGRDCLSSTARVFLYTNGLICLLSSCGQITQLQVISLGNTVLFFSTITGAIFLLFKNFIALILMHT